MFENFGMKDIWAVTKKYRCIIVIFLLISICLGALLGYQRIQPASDEKNTSAVSKTDTYEITSIYGVNTSAKEVTIQNHVATFSMLAKSEPCKQYVINSLKTKYSEEQLLEKLQLKNITIENATSKKYVQIATFVNSPMFAIIVRTEDKQLSQDIADAYHDYLTTQINQEINTASVSFVDSSIKQLSPKELAIYNINQDKIYVEDATDPLGFTATTEATNASSLSIIKYIILAFVGMAVLLFIAVATIALLYPTLNNKSDFAKYDIPVIGELGKIKGEIK